MLGIGLVGDVEDHHPGAFPRTVGTICNHVRTAMETKAELAGERVTAGEPTLLLCRIRLAGVLVLSWVPPFPCDVRISRIFDVDDGENVTLEAGERAGRVDPSTAVVKVAMCAGLTRSPNAREAGAGQAP
jgi:hypothetical protein